MADTSKTVDIKTIIHMEYNPIILILSPNISKVTAAKLTIKGYFPAGYRCSFVKLMAVKYCSLISNLSNIGNSVCT